jgi:hypothetical protein
VHNVLVATPKPALTLPQLHTLEVLLSGEGLNASRGLSPREVAQGLWPTSPAWGRRTHGRTGNRNGALGGTMPMNAAKLLHRLVSLHLAWQDDWFGYHVTQAGRSALLDA